MVDEIPGRFPIRPKIYVPIRLHTPLTHNMKISPRFQIGIVNLLFRQKMSSALISGARKNSSILYYLSWRSTVELSFYRRWSAKKRFTTAKTRICLKNFHRITEIWALKDLKFSQRNFWKIFLKVERAPPGGQKVHMGYRSCCLIALYGCYQKRPKFKKEIFWSIVSAPGFVLLICQEEILELQKHQKMGHKVLLILLFCPHVLKWMDCFSVTHKIGFYTESWLKFFPKKECR